MIRFFKKHEIVVLINATEILNNMVIGMNILIFNPSKYPPSKSFSQFNFNTFVAQAID